VPRLIGVLQLLVSLLCLVKRLDEQSRSRSGVPARSAGVNHGRLNDNLVQTGHRERQQKLHAEILVVRHGCLHHSVAGILLKITIFE